MKFYSLPLSHISSGIVMAYFLTTYVLPGTENPVLHILQILIGLLIIVMSVLCLGYILKYFFRPRADIVEQVSLGIASFMLGYPIILYLIYSLTHSLHDYFPIFISIATFLITAVIEIQDAREETITIQPSVFYRIALVFLIVLAVITLWYQPLPDSDPYGWIKTLEPRFGHDVLPPLTERPLFASLTYIWISLLQVDIFTFFKYLFPLLAASILIPLWLIIRTAPKPAPKFLFLLFVLGVPSTALYLIIPTPQAILIILSIYAAMFMLYSRMKNSTFYFLLAGIIFLTSFLYHQAAIILFLPWCVGALVMFRKQLYGKPITIAIILIAATLFSKQIRLMSHFVLYWGYKVYGRFFGPENVNLLYPAQYINIDQNQMGWPGALGVGKFYIYYASLVTGLTLLASLWVLWTTPRKKIVTFFSDPSVIVITLTLGIFILIAEVLPRFPNIAMLPERAWVFITIFTLPALYFLITNPRAQKIQRNFISLACIFLVVGIGGTIYINSLKRYLINPQQIASANWIQKNLPENRVFYGYNNENLILSHSKSQYIGFRKNIVCSDLSLEETLKHFDHTIQSEREILDEQLARAKGIPLNAPEFDSITIRANAQKYVYFAPKDSRNPYNNRGYNPENWGVETCQDGIFLFDQYPQTFERVYSKDGIIIWKYI